MAAIEIRGTLYDLQSRTARQVYLVGEGGLAGLSIGYPLPTPPGGGGDHIWGPTDPRPGNPISGIPGLPGYEPPLVIWGPNDPRPSPPIHLPPNTPPPIDVAPGGEKPPPDGQAGWGYYDGRWGYFPGPNDPQPK